MGGASGRVLGRAFDVRPGEGRIVALSLLQSLLTGVPRVVTVTAATTLFLSNYAAAEIPFAYMLGAPLIALIGIWAVRFERTHDPMTSVARILVLLFLALIFFRGAFTVPAFVVSAAGLLLVWSEVEWTLSTVTFWTVVNRVFTVRQAKRLFGVISVGEVLPTVVAGAAIMPLVEVIGVENLLLVSATAHLAASVNLRRLKGCTAPGEPDVGGALEARSSLRQTLRGRYVRLIAVVVCLNTVVYYAVDNGFYFVAEAHFSEADALAKFIGQLFVFLGLAHLGFKLFVAGPVMTKLGVRGALLVPPITIGAVACAVLLVGARSAVYEPLVLFAFVAMKLTERTSVVALHLPVYYTLYQPLAPSVRTRTQNVVDTVVGQAAAFVVGLFLVVLNHTRFVGPEGLIGVALVMAAGWGAAAFLLGGEYKAALHRSLGRRQFDATDVLDDAEAVCMVQEGLRSDNVAHVVYSVRLLVRSGGRNVESLLSGLIGSPHKSVRLAVSECLEDMGTSIVVPRLRDQFDDEQSRSVRGNIMCALSAIDAAGQIDFLRAQLEARDAPTRDGATVALLKHGGLEGAVLAGPRLLALLASTSDADRVRAAAMIGAVGVRTFYRGLMPLLSDANPAVRREACRAAAAVGNRALWPQVIDCLRDRRVRTEASRSLLLGGATEALIDALNADGQGREEIIRLLGRVDDRRAVPALLRVLVPSDRPVADAVLRALAAQRYVASGAERGVADLGLRREIGAFGEQVALLEEIEGVVGLALFRRALCDEIDGSVDMTLGYLALLYGHDLVDALRVHVEAGRTDAMALAVELLEATLNAEHRSLVLPVLDKFVGARPAIVDGVASQPGSRSGGAGISAETIGSRGYGWMNEWLRATLRSGDGDAPETAPARTVLGVPLLAGVGFQVLWDFAGTLETRRIERGSRLHRGGEVSGHTYVVMRGVLRESAHTERDYRRGAVVHEFGCLGPRMIPHDVIALEAAELLVVRDIDIRALLDARPEVSVDLLRNLCRRLRSGRSLEPAAALGSGGPRSAHFRAIAEPKALIERVIALGSAEVFADLDHRVLLELATYATERFADAGETVFRKGDRGRSMYVLFEGSVRVELDGAVVDRIVAPGIFGELAAMDPAPRAATIVAAEPSAFLVLGQVEVYELLLGYPSFSERLIQLLLARIG